MADIWLPIRPGTDVALMLGWLRIIIDDELYDRNFVEQWTVGFEDLKRAVSDYTPDRVAQITWLDPDLIVKSARLVFMSIPFSGFRAGRRMKMQTANCPVNTCIPRVHGLPVWPMPGPYLMR